MSAGLHVNDYRRRHTGSEATQGELFTNTGFKTSQEAFLSGNYEIGNAMLFADVQFRKARFEYQGSVAIDDLSWRFTNPRLGLGYTNSDNVYFYYSVGKSHREPTRTDLFAGSENLEADNDGRALLSDLKPESVIDHELGFRFARMSFSGNCNVYFMRFADELTLSGQFGPNGLPLNQSVEHSYRSGLELTANYQISDTFELKTTAIFSDNEIKESGQRFEPVLTPRKTASLALIHNGGDLQLEAYVRYQGEAFLNLANSERLPPYHYVVLSGVWSLGSAQILVQINNAMNRQYHASGTMGIDGEANYFVAAPRNSAVTLRVAF